jgi:acid phosphatase type 7
MRIAVSVRSRWLQRLTAVLSALLIILFFPRNDAGASVDIVQYAIDATTVAGLWRAEADSSAAGGQRLRHPNASAPKLTAPLASPENFFELTFTAEAGVGYRVWIRGRADNNSYNNDSVYLQFSDSVTSSGAAVYRIGTTSATSVVIEDCAGCGLSGWGWADNAYGGAGPLIYFAAGGMHTLRIQTREDGVAIDQIVLSAGAWLSTPPGATKNDATIVPKTGTTPTITLVRQPYLQRVAHDEATVVWATREPGVGEVRVWNSTSAAQTVRAGTRLVSAATTGMSIDYYQHEARVTGLAARTTYSYELQHDGADATPGITDRFSTAPLPDASTTRFIVFGDSGIGSTPQRQLAGLMSNDTFDLALHTGDLAYGTASTTGDATYQRYHDWFFDIYRNWLRRVAIFPALGNHDARSTNAHGRAYRDLFVLPANGASSAFPDHAERFYSFDWGPVHFVALDTELALQDATRRQAQLDWLAADLTASSQPWKVAYFHRSPYSAGGEHGSDLLVRQTFGPVFEAHGVQLVLSAHEHDYERTHPQRVSASGEFVTYVVTGGGGALLYPAGTAAWTAYSASVYHYVRGVADDCSLRLEAIGLNGAAFDTVTLDRCGAPPPPPPPPSGDAVLYASDAAAVAGDWSLVADSQAAGGLLLRNPDRGAPKATASANPSSYFEMTFTADAGRPYRLWARGRAENDRYTNDSVSVQFSDSVTEVGTATWRIGSTSATSVIIEQCSGCGLDGWGWNDNGYDGDGPFVRFATTGTHRVRVQVREDGVSLDQIVLSPSRFLASAPGAAKRDTTIVPK